MAGNNHKDIHKSNIYIYIILVDVEIGFPITKLKYNTTNYDFIPASNTIKFRSEFNFIVVELCNYLL